MIELFRQEQNRREFFRCVGRYLALGGLVSTTGVLIARRKPASSDEDSTDLDVCRRCTFLKRCDQPRALLAKSIGVGG